MRFSLESSEPSPTIDIVFDSGDSPGAVEERTVRVDHPRADPGRFASGNGGRRRRIFEINLSRGYLGALFERFPSLADTPIAPSRKGKRCRCTHRRACSQQLVGFSASDPGLSADPARAFTHRRDERVPLRASPGDGGAAAPRHRRLYRGDRRGGRTQLRRPPEPCIQTAVRLSSVGMRPAALALTPEVSPSGSAV